MTDWALMTDPATGRVGLYNQNGATGDQSDPNSTRNLPLNNPGTYLDKIKLSSDLDYLEVAFVGSGTITHASIAGIAAPVGQAVAYGVNAGSDDNVLLSHGMGYPPFALVAVGSNILWPGMPVQTNSDGGGRYASPYVDSSNLSIYTQATIGATTLPSATLTYSWLVFKDPPGASGHILADFDPSTGIVTLGLGKVSTDKPYLQVVAGGSPFGFSLGRTIDLNNGAPQAWRPDGTTFAPVPAGLKSYYPHVTYAGVQLGGETLGASMAYAGSYAGPSSVQVQAP